MIPGHAVDPGHHSLPVMDEIQEIGFDLFVFGYPAEKSQVAAFADFGNALAKGLVIGAGIDDEVKFAFMGVFCAGDARGGKKGGDLSDFGLVFFDDKGDEAQVKGIKGGDQPHGSAAVNQNPVILFCRELFKGVDDAAHRFCKTGDGGGKSVRQGDEAVPGQEGPVGESAVGVEPGDLHAFTEVFLSCPAKGADAAAFAGPYHEPNPGFVPDHHFMAQYPGENKVPVALLPHLGIGPADGAAEDVGQNHAAVGNLHLPVVGLDFKPAESGQYHFHSIFPLPSERAF